jgi:hypothetical protein
MVLFFSLMFSRRQAAATYHDKHLELYVSSRIVMYAMYLQICEPGPKVAKQRKHDKLRYVSKTE